MPNYNKYPGVDDNYEFPPPVRQAIATSDEVSSAMAVSIADRVPAEVATVIGNDSAVFNAAAAAVATAVESEDILDGTDPRAMRLVYDSPEWAILMPDSSGANAGGIRKDGTAEYFKVRGPITTAPKKSLTMTGDSLVASSNLPENLAIALGLPVTKYAWNGETTDGIVFRLGVLQTRWTVVGGSIPASGSVNISTKHVLALPDVDTYISGSMLGIPGRLYFNAGVTSFVRDASGSAVSAPGLVQFMSWPSDFRDQILGVLWGRNDVSNGSKGLETSVLEHMMSNCHLLADHMATVHKQYFFMGTLNRATEPRGHVNYDLVLAYNQKQIDDFPGKYIEVRNYMVNQAIYDMGITPNAQDLESISNDCPPWSIMTDLTHPKPEAWQAAITNVIKPWLIGKEYV